MARGCLRRRLQRDVPRFHAAFHAIFGGQRGALRQVARRCQASEAGRRQRGGPPAVPRSVPPGSRARLSGGRAVPGVEGVGGGTDRRTVRVGPAGGTVEVERPPGAGWLVARVALSDLGQLAALPRAAAPLFDLDADPAAIDPDAGPDPLLAADVAQPAGGWRVPGAWDGIEIGVRAILGQQVSVAGARTLAGRIAARLATRGRRRPRAAVPDRGALAGRTLAAVGVMPARARRPRARGARRGRAGPAGAAPAARPRTVRRPGGAPGIGPWTAQYVAPPGAARPRRVPRGRPRLARAAAGAAGRSPRGGSWSARNHGALARLRRCPSVDDGDARKAEEIKPRWPMPEPATAAAGSVRMPNTSMDVVAVDTRLGSMVAVLDSSGPWSGSASAKDWADVRPWCGHAVSRHAPAAAPVADQLGEYFAGDRRAFDLKLAPRGGVPPFGLGRAPAYPLRRDQELRRDRAPGRPTGRRPRGRRRPRHQPDRRRHPLPPRGRGPMGASSATPPASTSSARSWTSSTRRRRPAAPAQKAVLPLWR